MSNKYIYSLDNRKILLNSLNSDIDVYEEIKKIDNPNDIVHLIENGYLKPKGIANNVSENSKVGDKVDCVLLSQNTESIYKNINEFDVFIDNDVIMILNEKNNKFFNTNKELEEIINKDFNSISNNNFFKLGGNNFYEKYQEAIKMDKKDIYKKLNNSDFDTNITISLFIVNEATGLHNHKYNIPEMLNKINSVGEDNLIRLSNFLNKNKNIDGKLKINFNNAHMLYKMNKNELPLEYIENKMKDKFINKKSIDSLIKTLDVKNEKNKTNKKDNYFQRKFNGPLGKDMFSR